MSIFENLITNLKNIFANFFTLIEEPLQLLCDNGIIFTMVFLILFITISVILHKESIKNLRSTKTLVVCAMLIALNFIIKVFNIEIGNYLRIGFGFITLPIASMFYGPFVGALLGIVQDITYYMFRQTGPYLPLMGLGAMITGLINGLFLYKKKITFLNIAFATLLNAVIVSMLINTIALVPIINKAITIFFK